MCSILEKQGESLKNHRLVYKNGRNALRVFCTLTFLLIALPAFTQVSGIKTICSSGCNYSTITSAVNDINTNGVGAGGVTFNVSAGFTETATGQIIISTTTSSVSNPVIFKKSGSGANPVLTAQTGAGGGTTDGIIKISGADYITFDAIDVIENSSNTSSARMDWGYAIVKASASNGCDNIVIKNCNVTLDKTNTNSIGIYAANHPSGSTSTYTVTTAGGRHTNLYFYGNTISNCYSGIKSTGYGSYNDSNIWVGTAASGNTITNFCGGSTSGYGVFISSSLDLHVYNNTINGGTGSTSSLTGIYLGSSDYYCNVRVYHNTITLLNSSTNSSTVGLQVQAGGGSIGNTVEVDSNVVENCRMVNSSSPVFYGIYLNSNPDKLLCHDNIVRGNRATTAGDVYLIYQTGVATGDTAWVYNNKVYNNYLASISTMYCIRVGGGVVRCYSNEIYNDTAGGSSSAIYALYNASATAASETYANNTIYNLINNGTGAIYGINITSASGTKTISGNYFHGFSGKGTMWGFMCNYGTPLYVYNNRITDFQSSGTTGIVYGMYLNPTTAYIYNNMISDLRSPNGTTHTVIGIFLSAGTIKAYHNTVYLEGTSGGANFGGTALYSNTTTNLDLRNNILVNLTTPNGSGLATAFRRSSTNLTNYSDSSDNNCFYAGTPTSVNLIFYDGTNSDQTISAFKTRAGTNRDSLSFSELPPFMDIGTQPYDLHLKTNVATSCEGGGTGLSMVPTDFDGNSRSGSNPDVGADEGNFTMVPVTWLSFAAQTADKKVHLHWSTASEINNSHFEIERSVDGFNFTYVGRKDGKGTTNSISEYGFTDIDAFSQTQAEVLYYRLKQVDYNGNYEYSRTIAINNNGQSMGSMELITFPNPFTEKLNLTLNNVSEGNVTIEVYDLSGRKHYTQTTLSGGQGTLSIDLSSLANLAKGVYIVNIKNGNEAIQQKLVKLK